MRMRSVREAYKELKAADPDTGIGLRTLYRLVADGTIPSRPMGRKYLIDLDRLEEYLGGQTAKGGYTNVN